MSAWKVILATVVIFVAGGFAGGFVSRKLAPPVVVERSSPWMMTTNYVGYLDKNLSLNPEQREKILQVVTRGQERVSILQGLIGDDLREEFQLVREEIRNELTPEQRIAFDELKQKRHRRGDGRSKRDDQE